MTAIVFIAACNRYGLEKWRPEEHLELSRHYMDMGDFEASLKESRAAYELYPRSLGDQALFQMGLIYSHPDNPDRNFQKARNTFQRIVETYPFSRFRSEAELWLKVLSHESSLNKELMRINTELTRLENELRDMERKWVAQKKTVKQQQSRYNQLIESKDRQIKIRDQKIQELQRSIDQLKEIDLKIEERKRKTP